MWAREKEEQKKKAKEAEEAAKIFDDFVKSFEADDNSVPKFVKGDTIGTPSTSVSGKSALELAREQRAKERQRAQIPIQRKGPPKGEVCLLHRRLGTIALIRFPRAALLGAPQKRISNPFSKRSSANRIGEKGSTRSRTPAKVAGQLEWRCLRHHR